MLVTHLDGLLDTDQGDLSSDGLQLNELSSAGDKILKFLLFFSYFGGGCRLYDLGELREIAGINGICLGTMSQPFGEVAGLP